MSTASKRLTARLTDEQFSIPYAIRHDQQVTWIKTAYIKFRMLVNPQFLGGCKRTWTNPKFINNLKKAKGLIIQNKYYI